MSVTEAVLDLPAWLLSGVALGAVLSGLVALTFVLGRRRFPDRAPTGPRTDGAERRRREIRRYLEAIGEDYREDHAVEGVRVAFYLPDRELAITFDARAYFRIRDAGVEAVLVEHELPGASLGTRLPFETPTFGRRSRDASGDAARADAGRGVGGVGGPRSGDRRADSSRSTGSGATVQQARARAAEQRRLRAAFATLGLPPDADLSTVRGAYRERVKEVHPDQGGDRERFQRVRDAYDLAARHATETAD